ncbi:MobV family relaxase [Muribaculum intestinale]|uniref:MobV family relaxase n=1 Tax=Muribaculum intestinale TaxID=1796646 RepID=UPI002430063C|nr:MobV family relaxase [Muribaculum intestinale]
MSYAVLHIMKASGSCTAIARHIERSTQPDNAHPELRHLNRDDFIRYPDGVAGLGEAIQHRIDHAGLTRKVGKNQVLALNVLLSSDGEALRRLADEGRLNEWAEASVGWAKETFGEANVVGAHLHMDEQTPHLHVTVVPIVTTERRRRASEAKATKRYRTKPKNGPRLSADDIMTRDNLTSFQDTYAKAMERFGLERGVRGSEARHVDQHEYYRDCQRKKKDLKHDVNQLAIEKNVLSIENRSLKATKEKTERETKVLEGKKILIEGYNSKMLQENAQLTYANERLLSENESLSGSNSSLVAENKELTEEKERVSGELAVIESDRRRLTAEKKACEEEAETAKRETEVAKREAAEAKAERDRQKKEAVSSIANIFTGSKTKRLESEIADRDRTIENLKLQMSSQRETSSREIGNLRDSMRRQQEQHDSYRRGFDSQMSRIEKYFPSVKLLMPAILDCESVRMSEGTIKALLDCKPRIFNPGKKLYDPARQEYADVSNTEVQFKRDPKDNQFHLHINGKNIFQWFKDLWQSLRQTISRGIRR